MWKPEFYKFIGIERVFINQHCRNSAAIPTGKHDFWGPVDKNILPRDRRATDRSEEEEIEKGSVCVWQQAYHELIMS